MRAPLRGRCRAAVAGAILLAPLALAQSLSRQEIENAKRYDKGPEPTFSTIAPASLAGKMHVVARRSFAVFGYNTPTVQVRMPPIGNSSYARVTFADAKPLSKDGKELAHEIENGLYDPETHSTEIRFTAPGGKGLVPLDRAVGRVHVHYPVAVRTIRVHARSAQARKIGIEMDGPYVTYSEKALGLPDILTISGVEPLRAYDASGRRLERYENYEKTEFHNDVSRKTIAFWGKVAGVRYDTVGRWSDVDLPFDLPAAPLRPAGKEGIGP